MNNIHEFIVAKLYGPGLKTIFEVGAHIGTDTAHLAKIPGSTVHAFEPDPRNELPALANVVRNRVAVGAADGEAEFTPSAKRGAWDWTCSGSLRKPKEHLKSWPDVTFGEPIKVQVVTLDSYCRKHGVGVVDFVWADVQGAEVDMIKGGAETLKRTRYLYTEFSWKELYEGQVNLEGILALLGPAWRLVQTFPTTEDYADALLENTEMLGR